MVEFIEWQASKKRKVVKLVGSEGYSTFYFVEKTIKIKLHFICSSLSTLYGKHMWTVKPHETEKDTFVFEITYSNATPTVNGFELVSGNVVLCFFDPEKNMARMWKAKNMKTSLSDASALG